MHMNQNTSKDLLGTQGKTFEKALVEKQVFTPKSSYFQMRWWKQKKNLGITIK